MDFLPIKIREIAWKQIDKYDSVEFRNRNIVDVIKEEEYEDGIFVITDDNETSIKAKKVVLAVDAAMYIQISLDL